MKEIIPISEAAPELLERSRGLLEQAKTLDQVLRVRRIAKTAEQYYRAANQSHQVVLEASALKLEAERKAGEMLRITRETGERATETQGRPPKAFPNGTLSPTLAELDVTRKQSHIWQKIAEIPAKIFKGYIARAKQNVPQLTTAELLRIAKEADREKQRDRNRALVDETEPIQSAEVYPTIVIDPPWDWGDEGDVDQLGRARPEYATMPLKEIAELPVAELADKDAHLYLWITNRSLPKGFGLLDQWGFRYVTTITWIKPHFGMGNYFRGSSEHILFGVRGSLPLLRHDVGTWFSAPRPGEHSGKPAEFYSLVETCSPGPWLEMFARRERPGWGTWGAEVATASV